MTYVRLVPVYKIDDSGQAVAVLRMRSLYPHDYEVIKYALRHRMGRVHVPGGNRSAVERLVKYGLAVKVPIVHGGTQHQYFLTELANLTVTVNEQLLTEEERDAQPPEGLELEDEREAG